MGYVVTQFDRLSMMQLPSLPAFLSIAGLLLGSAAN